MCFPPDLQLLGREGKLPLYTRTRGDGEALPARRAARGLTLVKYRTDRANLHKIARSRGVTLVTIPGTGHASLNQKPDQIAELVLAAVSVVSPRA